tara:strand:+ start:15476 stop:16969 length:1494 start_codon:yes stop_codon:yes gene_type:complete
MLMDATHINQLKQQLPGTKVVVIGAARSGVGAAELLHKAGAVVFVSDHGAISNPMRERLQKCGIAFEEGGHTAAASDGTFAVLSPGVPTNTALVQEYVLQNKAVVSEIELASWYCTSPMIAITGSNGKTTVSSWVRDCFVRAGRPNELAGNIGRVFSEQCIRHGLVHSISSDVEISAAITSEQNYIFNTARHPSSQGEFYWILEVSSFQLDHIHTFCPNVSVLLNITPDHLDRYNHSMDEYAASKFRITEQQLTGQTFIYNYDDLRVRSYAQYLQSQSDAPRIWAFSTQEPVERGAFLDNNNIIFRFNNHEEILMSPFELVLQGQHNLQNGLATALAVRACEIKNEVIRESLSRFTGVEHRLEVVRKLDGVKYINDSKATNVNAVWFALDSIKTPLILIIGGRDKGNDYTELRDQLIDKVHTVIAIGESRERIQEQIGDIIPHFIMADDMRVAVRYAQKQAKKGEVVLLSPACSSFDMFDNYEHRGREFKECVQHLS